MPQKEILQKKKTQTGIRSANKLTPKPKFKAPQTPTDAHEHSFWNTPAASARTLRFTDDLLTDEQFDPGNLTDPLFASPLSEVKPPPKLLKAGRNVDPVRQLKFATTKPSEPLSNNRGSMSFAFQEPNLPLEEVVDPEVEANDEEDETIILRKASDTPPCEAIVAPSQATAGSLESNIGSSEQLKKAKLRITTELEDIIVCIE